MVLCFTAELYLGRPNSKILPKYYSLLSVFTAVRDGGLTERKLTALACRISQKAPDRQPKMKTVD